MSLLCLCMVYCPCAPLCLISTAAMPFSCCFLLVHRSSSFCTCAGDRSRVILQWNLCIECCDTWRFCMLDLELFML
ncbi:hypothetical protein BRADI_4g27454v3 [Brachypodium distachyon]|uniref:Secreted protein n=1 Tax=Brachypodium distachyon TaxID=15368 RepID=A0A2K2CQP8_BRADI|nr:hypothetical protein BRADI_4g27454v3 [Brachypodium distachyon]